MFNKCTHHAVQVSRCLRVHAGCTAASLAFPRLLLPLVLQRLN